MVSTVRLAVIGLGNIGRNLLDVMVHRQDAVDSTYGLRIVVVGAADSSGAAIDAEGLDLAQLRDLKTRAAWGGSLPGGRASRDGRPGHAPDVAFDVLVDASPTNMVDGEPGMACVRHALDAGRHVVMADKGPLVLAFGELADLASNRWRPATLQRHGGRRLAHRQHRRARPRRLGCDASRGHL